MRIAAAIVSVLLFIVIFSGGILYTFNQTRVYEAQGTLEIIDPKPVPVFQLEDLSNDFNALGVQEVLQTEQSNEDRTESDLQTQLVRLRSNTLVNEVDGRLSDEVRRRFIAPYLSGPSNAAPMAPIEILASNRQVERIGKSRTFRVGYRHPDPELAAYIANCFMEEFINLQLSREIDSYMKMVEDLRDTIRRFDQQIKRIEEDANEEKSKRLNTLYDIRNKLVRATDEAKSTMRRHLFFNALDF